MRWFFFVVVAAVAWAVRVMGRDVVHDPSGSALLGLGCLIIGGVLAGEVARRLRLPRITGYLVLGIVAGPHLTGIVTSADHKVLNLFEELALGLIALTAGGEFRVSMLRKRIGPLLAITASHCIVMILTVTIVIWLSLNVWQWLGPMAPGHVLAASLLLGVIAVANSPATTIAVITEARAKGELVDTVLGVTILKDLVILFLFAWVSVLATAWVTGGETSLGLLRGVGVEVVLSLAVGAVLGGLLGAYVLRVGRQIQLVVLLLALVSAELAHGAGLEHLLVCMAAGFVVRNLFPSAASEFIDALEQSSAPIYIVFFALIGVGLDLGTLLAVGVPAAGYLSLRMSATWLMTRIPAQMAGSGPVVVRYAWTGFVAQAGLSLGFAARLQRELPGVGQSVATVVVAAVVINQLVGPVLWARSLIVSGEARELPD